MADNQNEPATAVLPPSPSDPAGFSDWEKSIRRIVKSEIRRSLPQAIQAATRELVRDEEIAGLIQLIAARSNDAKDEVLRKALTLYGLALDAREKGNKLAIISPDDYIIHDVIGFESMVEAMRFQED